MLKAFSHDIIKTFIIERINTEDICITGVHFNEIKALHDFERLLILKTILKLQNYKDNTENYNIKDYQGIFSLITFLKKHLLTKIINYVIIIL